MFKWDLCLGRYMFEFMFLINILYMDYKMKINVIIGKWFYKLKIKILKD